MIQDFILKIGKSFFAMLLYIYVPLRKSLSLAGGSHEIVRNTSVGMIWKEWVGELREYSTDKVIMTTAGDHCASRWCII